MRLIFFHSVKLPVLEDFGGLILPAHSDFKVCYLSLRSSGNCLHLPVFPAKIPQSSDIDANKPNFRGRTLGSHPGI